MHDISSEMMKQALKLSNEIEKTEQKGALVTMLEDKTLIYPPEWRAAQLGKSGVF